MTRHRLLFLARDLLPRGTSEQVGFLSIVLPKDEFDVHVAAYDLGARWPEKLRYVGVEVHSLGRARAADPLALGRLWRLVRRLQPDLVHVWDPELSLAGRAAAACLNGEPTLIETIRGAAPRRPCLARPLERWLDRRSAALVCDSQTARRAARAAGRPEQNLCVIPFGVPTEPASSSRDDLLAQLRLPPECRLVLAAGSLTRDMRWKDLIWAADLLKVIRPDVHLLIVGEGPQRARLEKFRAQVRIADKVHFLGERSDLRRLVASADLFWLAGDREGTNVPLLHALAAGLPVVAANAGGATEIITDGQDGFLVPPGDRAAFAARTNRLLDEPDLAARLSAAARLRAADFTTARMCQSHLELYRQLL